GVIVPHIADQRMWAGVAARLGVAPAGVPRPDLTPERLAGAIIATRNPRMASRAARLGELIRGEDGVGEAVRLVERVARIGGG
ncbi:MAG: glycosyltransferase, partial [Chloroflexota bacterium]|nr:glycosyltransferase [Chloroflexota bacterium]